MSTFKRITITELARDLKLSTCTVSKILNHSFDGFSYHAKTIARVEEYAKRVGYVANAQARSLRTRKTMLMGFLLPSEGVAFFGSLTDHLESELRKHGYQMLIAHSPKNHGDMEREILTTLIARGVDGLIWIPSGEKIPLSKMGIPSRFPVVIVDRPHCTERIPFIASDNQMAGRELAMRVQSAGHRKIAVLTTACGDRSMAERLQGICEAIPKRYIRAVEVPEGNHLYAKEATKALFKEKKEIQPEVLIALSEPLAIGALSGLRDLHLQIPQDVSFAAFDDFPLADCWTPPITVVRQNIHALALETVRLLLKRMKEPSASFSDVRVKAHLEWRDSVAQKSHS